LQQVVRPFIPHEFTANGFVERLHAYLSHQRFCPQHETDGEQHDAWPPTTELVVRLSASAESCTRTCHIAGQHYLLHHKHSPKNSIMLHK